jgi:hypothetical protein
MRQTMCGMYVKWTDAGVLLLPSRAHVAHDVTAGA